MRYRLRTLLIVLALGPPLLALAILTVMIERERAELESAIRSYKSAPADYAPADHP